jgi:hypothetical protein
MRQYPLPDHQFLASSDADVFWSALIPCLAMAKDVQGLEKIMETLQTLYTFLY